MEVVNAIVAFLSQVPWWVWVVLVFGLLVVFGDRGLWDLEVKFPLTEGVGRGEVEFEGYKKRGHTLEARFHSLPNFEYNTIEILLEGVSVATIPTKTAPKHHLFSSKKIEHGQPREGQVVTVVIDGREVFSGPLVKD
jgi:hypothetical protein